MLAVEKVTDPAEFLNKSYQYLYENGIDTNVIIHVALYYLDNPTDPITGAFFIVYDF
jgi:hypothetical protein